MSYLVLARKFRPQTFASVSGQSHITRALSNAVVRDRVPHALLFSGPRGVGKTTTARVLAKSLNCQNRSQAESKKASPSVESAEPCDDCVNCKEITKGSSLAVWEVDGASNNSVDDVRSLIDSLHSLPPPGSIYKIYIIDEVHMLSTAAFNALLKSLEEPPPNTIFIFATTEPQKIPETVISRCQRHDFRRIDTGVIVEQLEFIAKREKVKVEPGVLSFIARRAQGGMRDAQSLFDRLLSLGEENIGLDLAARIFGAVDHSFFPQLSSAILAADSKQALSLLEKVFSHSLDVKSFADDFVGHWRNLLILSAGGTDHIRTDSLLSQLGEDEIEKLTALTSQSNDFDLQRLFEMSESISKNALSSSYPRYIFEAGCVKMALLPSLKPIAEILAQGSFSQDSFSRSTVSSRSKPAGNSDRIAVVPSVKKKSTDSVESKLEEAKSTVPEVKITSKPDFVPTWQEFVNYAKGRSESMLTAYLRRVRLVEFKIGILKLEASEFDISALQDSDTSKTLKNCLYSYSGQENWKVEFSKIEQLTSESAGSSGESSKSGLSQNMTMPVGSLAAKEEVDRKNRSAQLKKEAVKQTAVKEILNTFDGSVVERVVPIIDRRDS